MTSEYRKITMNPDLLWEMYQMDFETLETGGFSRLDEESGLEFIYPEKFYKLWNGKPLAPDHFRTDNEMSKNFFCPEYANHVAGNFAYICGTYQEIESRRQFIFSFDTEKGPEECLPHMLIRYSWDKQNDFEAGPLPEEVIGPAGVLYHHDWCSDYEYNGVQYLVVPTTIFFHRVIMINYYVNLGRLINSANAKLDHFDQHKHCFRNAFEKVAKPAIESLSGNTVEFTDEEMVATYTDSHNNKVINRYRFDIVGWESLRADPDYGPQVSKEALDEEGLVFAVEDEG